MLMKLLSEILDSYNQIAHFPKSGILIKADKGIYQIVVNKQTSTNLIQYKKNLCNLWSKNRTFH